MHTGKYFYVYVYAPTVYVPYVLIRIHTQTNRPKRKESLLITYSWIALEKSQIALKRDMHPRWKPVVKRISRKIYEDKTRSLKVKSITKCMKL